MTASNPPTSASRQILSYFARFLVVTSAAGSIYRRMLTRFAIDAVIVAVAMNLAFLIRFQGDLVAMSRTQLALGIVLVMLGRWCLARLWGMHRSSWRLFGLRETELLAATVASGTGILLAARLLFPGFGLPVGVIALEGLLTLGGQWAARAWVRLVDEHRIRIEHGAEFRPTRVLLVGAGRDGRLAAEELRARPQAGYCVVGFLDDAPERRGQIIAGVPVLGTIDEAREVADAARAEMLVLTMPSASRAQRRNVVERCRGLGLELRTVPAYWELLGGKVEVSRIRSIKIEDLLGREVVRTEPARLAELKAAYEGKRILVTGAGGSIGSELCRQLAALSPASLVLFEYSENNLFDIDAELRPALGERLGVCLADIRDAQTVRRIFSEYRPQVVFHAAAYKHVPMMELHPEDAVDNNVRGTRVIVEAAHEVGAERFLFVSTDKAVNPTNVMGATKRAGEMVVQAKARSSQTKMCCVRFGNVLGSRGSVLHTFRRQIEVGGPVTVTHPEITRFFMTIPEAVRLVLQAGAAGKGGEIFLLDMGEPVKIVDMARQMIRLAGHDESEIAVEFVGLRPGEKLYEELAHRPEDVVASGMDGINVVRPGDLDAPSIVPWVARIEAAASQRNVSELFQLLAMGTGYCAGGGATTARPSAVSRAS